MIRPFHLFWGSLFLLSSTLVAQPVWELRKDQNGIRIYSRPAKDSKYNELKAVFDLPGTFEQLHAVLLDVSNYKTWVYATTSSILIEKKSAIEMVYYSRISAPWPVSNRDFYSDTRIWIDSGRQQMRVSSRNMDNFPLSKEHIVRIPFLKAEWNITAPSSERLHVEYTLSWDPGGNIPAFLANAFSTNGPLQSFSQLKRKMALLPAPLAANK
jgi:hypothetical protein